MRKSLADTPPVVARIRWPFSPWICHWMLLACVPLLVAVPTTHGQEPVDTAGPSVTAGVGAAIGVTAGMLGGYRFGEWFAEEVGIGQGGEDPGLAVGLLGGLAAALVGGSLGAHIGGRATPGAGRPSFWRRVRDTGIGILMGLPLAYVGAKVAGSDKEEYGAAIGFGVGVGFYSGLSNGRW